MTRTYRYSPRAMAFDGAQGACGLALSASLLRFAEPAAPVIGVLAAMAALFLVYFCRAVVRYLTRIELDEREIRALGPLGARIPWEEMCSLRLDHFTTRSDRSGGWMQLDLRATQRSIRVDSSLIGFAGLAALAAREALRHGTSLDQRTRSNFRALDIRLHG